MQLTFKSTLRFFSSSTFHIFLAINTFLSYSLIYVFIYAFLTPLIYQLLETLNI